MARHIILGLLVAASLSGCFDGTSGSPTVASGASTVANGFTTVARAASTVTSGTTAVAAGAGTGSNRILLQGVPPSSVTVGGKYSFQPSVSGNKVVTFAIQGQPS